MMTADIPVGPPIVPTCRDCWTISAPRGDDRSQARDRQRARSKKTKAYSAGRKPPPDAANEVAPIAQMQRAPRPRWIERREYDCVTPAPLRSLINRCESGELHFREGRPRCHCADMASFARTVRLLISSF